MQQMRIAARQYYPGQSEPEMHRLRLTFCISPRSWFWWSFWRISWQCITNHTSTLQELLAALRSIQRQLEVHFGLHSRVESIPIVIMKVKRCVHVMIALTAPKIQHINTTCSLATPSRVPPFHMSMSCFLSKRLRIDQREQGDNDSTNNSSQ